MLLQIIKGARVSAAMLQPTLKDLDSYTDLQSLNGLQLVSWFASLVSHVDWAYLLRCNLQTWVVLECISYNQSLYLIFVSRY